jgi:hypothetical protein
MNLITGNKFKKISDYVFDGNTLTKTDVHNDIPIYFVKTDFIDLFFNNFLPNVKFKLITHNSDYDINNNHVNYLNSENLVLWFGQNININHPKLKSIPIGIANEIWEHGNEDVILSNLSEIKKNNLIFCGFDVNTNKNERLNCLSSINKYGIKNSNKLEFNDYIKELKNSYFSISPNGNGVDCHKTWESLYLKTIPIVTESINTISYSDLPIYIIESWDKFNLNDINISLYNKLIEKFDYSKIDIEYYYNKIKKN